MNINQRTGVNTFIRILNFLFSSAHDFQLQAAQAKAQTKACKRACKVNARKIVLK
ncbi:MAG: hypothetical protein KatS3mg027_0236 [Bacteroidia bacterium]|nr:MAG: hypothetical protein KatS3mg027_0236 [Bacteroidia bacterium]